MTAATKDRNTPEIEGTIFSYGVKAATKLYAGTMICLDAAGKAVAGSTATTLTAVGRAQEQVDNSAGLDDALNVKVKRGIFRFSNSTAGDAIADTEIGDVCYIVDDQTVAKTDGGSTRSPAGIVQEVDAQGVWVLIGYGPAAASGALLAANNLSDVGSKGTSRTNLGVYESLGTPTFVIGAEAANVINVGVQLKDSAGANLAVRAQVLAYLSDDANGDSVAVTAPDGGVVIGTDGVAIPVVAGKFLALTSEADGDIDIDITESAVDTWYLILVMPDGKLVASGAITFA